MDKQQRAEVKAEESFGQALWYAWGRLDSGQYGPESASLETFEFAKRVKAATLDFELEKTHSNESIQGAWDRYVAEKTKGIGSTECYYAGCHRPAEIRVTVTHRSQPGTSTLSYCSMTHAGM